MTLPSDKAFKSMTVWDHSYSNHHNSIFLEIHVCLLKLGLFFSLGLFSWKL